jgi:ribosomal protein L3 glutamine methyltransferase
VFVPRSPLVAHLAAVAEPLAGRRARVLDVGCGCGALGIMLALALPDATVELVDVSPAAVAAARSNVARYGLGDRARVVAGDLLAGCEGPYDLVVSNPPHVPTRAVASAPAEVRAEPAVAWDGGADGLDVVRRLLDAVPVVLAPAGRLLVDVGAEGRRALPTERPDLSITWLGPPRGASAGAALVQGPWAAASG